MISLFLLVSACQQSPAATSPPTITISTTISTTFSTTVTVTSSVTTPTPTATGDLDILPAPIHEVDIRFAESLPVQVFLYVKGGLPDGCAKFHGIEIKERRSNTTVVGVTYDHPRGATCPAIYGFFEQNINLGTDFKSGETYTVIVNDVSKSFTMQ